jgi:hypothetical protein
VSDEPFLARWSRRKLEAAEGEFAPAKPEQAEARKDPARVDTDFNTAAPTPPAPDTFDPASLPSLDSITPATDIRGFLAPNVPAALTRAALRRAWAADPAIRDFVGLQEYDWDFNAPGAVFGFEELGSEHDVKQLLARVFGEDAVPALDDRPESGPAASTQAPDKSHEPAPSVEHSGAAPTARSHGVGKADPAAGTAGCPSDAASGRAFEELVQRNHHASHPMGEPHHQPEPTKRRSHGGALPIS